MSELGVESPTPAVLGHRLVRADAGAGKTYALAVRYLALLAAGVGADRILAATFTRKAAGEILERILLRLARAADEPAAAAALAADLPVGDGVPPFAELLARLTEGLHRLQVGTLDAFLHRVTTAFRLELGLPAAASVMAAEDPALAGLRLAAVDGALDELAEEGEEALVDLLGRLYRGDAQRSVATALDRVVLEVYETYRLAPDGDRWTGVENPHRALAPTELAAAIDRLADEAAAFDGKLWKAILNDYRQARLGDWLGFSKGGVAAKVAEDPERPSYDRRALPRDLVRAYRPLVEHARWDLLDRLCRQTEATHRLIAAFDRRFERLRRRRGVVLFSDFSRLLTGRLAGADEETVLDLFYRLDARVEHLLLDELQDTSLEQWLALAWLTDEILAWGDGSRTLFCVGDPKQSIYGWRGGCAELFDLVETRLEDPDRPTPEVPAGASGEGPLTRLGVSYRSSPVVLAAVDAVFRRLERNPALPEGAAREEAARWARRYEPHRAADPDRPGWVRLITSARWEGEFAPDLRSRPLDDDSAEDEDERLDEGRPASHLADAADRIAEIAERVGRPSEEGEGAQPASAGAAAGPPLPAVVTVGVLTLTNRTAAELLALLRERGVRASGEGGGPLVDDPAVTAMLSALWLAAHPGDSAAAFHVARSPLGPVVGLDTDPVDAVARRIREALLARGAPSLLAGWARAVRPATSRRSGARLAQLVALAEVHEREGLGGPFELVARARAATVEEPSPAPVRVMTVHRAKGLEFDVVVLPELERRIGDLNNPLVLIERAAASAPIASVVRGTNQTVRSASERLQAIHAQEVARRTADDLGVLYVALTRARHELHLVVQPRAPGRAGRSTFAELLRWGLAEERREQWGEGCATLHESGAPAEPAASLREARRAPRRASSGAAHPASFAEEASPTSEEPQLAVRPAVPRLAIERPSTLGGGADGRAAAVVGDLLRLEPPLERLRGRVVHHWLRQVEWLEADGGGLPDRDRARRSARAVAPAVEGPVVDGWWDELRAALASPEIAAVFTRPPGRRGAYRLWRERSFALALDGRLVRGVVDRAVLWGPRGAPVGAELWELKSDRLGGRDPAVLVERHGAQVRSYCEALASMLGLLPTAVSGWLVLLDAGTVRRVV